MLTLGFDTSTDIGSIGLVDGEDVKGEYSFAAKESQSERLLASIDLLLNETCSDISEIEKIAVSRGPGSFTGLRIGISTARGLTEGLQVPLVGISLTDSYYCRVESYPGPVCVLIKDRRNLVYTATFDKQGDKVLDEESISIENLEAKIASQLKRSTVPVLVVGNAVPAQREYLREARHLRLAQGTINYPSGLQIALLGEGRKASQDTQTDLEPLYAQRPIAEINWNAS